MRPIIVADIETAAVGDLPPGVHAAGGAACEVRRVLDGAKAPIHLAAYRLAPGGTVEWDAAEQSRTLYLRGGELTINGARLGPGSVIVIESGAVCQAEGAGDGADFIEFCHNREVSARRGGRVHAVAGGDSPVVESEGVRSAVHADACCEGCGVWLHENHILAEGYPVALHSHTEDEVIVVLDGELVAGARHLGPGHVLSVARHTFYGFSTGKGGLRFINFRPSRPGYIPKGSDKAIDEMGIYEAKGLAPAVHAVI